MITRPSCILCAIKHVGQARALSLEARKGYSHFFWFALGHMAEAEDELVMEFPALADPVRAARKAWEMDPFTPPDFAGLVTDIARAGGYDLDAEYDLKEKETTNAEHDRLAEPTG